MSRRPSQVSHASFSREPAVKDWLINNGFNIVSRKSNRLGYTYIAENEAGDRATTRYGNYFHFKFEKAE